MEETACSWYIHVGNDDSRPNTLLLQYVCVCVWNAGSRIRASKGVRRRAAERERRKGQRKRSVYSKSSVQLFIIIIITYRTKQNGSSIHRRVSFVSRLPSSIIAFGQPLETPPLLPNSQL